MKDQSVFGVVLIRDGSEVGPASTFSVGTTARITDWFQGSDGLLGLHVTGEQRFQVNSASISPSGLNMGDITLLQPEPVLSGMPDRFGYMTEMLQSIISQLPEEAIFHNPQLDDPQWVVSRLAEVLPIGLEERQECLELEDTAERLGFLEPYFSALRNRS